MKQFIFFIIGLLVFLKGISLMSHSLEKLVLNKIRMILDKMTDSLLKAIVFGILASIILHSSSTLTILIIAFVSSGHMKLNNATMVIMGANVGTTLSASLFFIDLNLYVYVLFVLGLIVMIKNKYAGKTVIGLSMLLIGLNIMQESLSYYQNDLVIMNVLSQDYHPLLLVLVGIVICSVIQSSSACMAILLSFSQNGMITFMQGAFLLYGFDIGTCLDTSLASLSSNKEGRKVAVFHLLFNITGTLLFTLISLLTPFLSLFQIIDMHLSFLFTLLHSVMNIITLVLFICINDIVLEILNKYIV